MRNSWVSIYIAALVLGWLGAHIVKFIIALTQGRRDLTVFFRSGSMPSSHTAVVVALATVIGSRQGVDSALFGLAATLAAIVIFDALNVRRAVGEQGEVLAAVAKKKFFTAKGHTLTEVIVGGALGFVIGVVLLQIL